MKQNIRVSDALDISKEDRGVEKESKAVKMASPVPPDKKTGVIASSWRAWLSALKAVLPIYIAIRLALLAFTVLATLYQVKDYSLEAFSVGVLWRMWLRKDAWHFVHIAEKGYTEEWRTAFFPLFPMLERAGAPVFGHPFLAGMVIANVAALVLMVVFYRLVKEDFGKDVAERSIVYLTVFPTAFFLVTGYSEAVFLALVIVSFYGMRRGHWWWAGLFGFLAALTRSAGLFLVLPFLYEYLRQKDFKIRNIRLSILAGGAMPLAVALYGLWCYITFGDFIAFAHAQEHWNRYTVFPGYSIWLAMVEMKSVGSVINWYTLRGMIDLGLNLFILILLILGLVGPWRFSRQLVAYSVLGWSIYLFVQTSPVKGMLPLQSVSRYVLAVLPAFIVLSVIAGRYRFVQYTYQWTALAVLFYLLSLFLINRWVI